MNALKKLAGVVWHWGPVPAVRVSVARPQGRAKKYKYWGVVEYEIRARKRDGVLTAIAMHRAKSERRSLRLAQQDAEHLARLTGWVIFRGPPGPLSEESAAEILAQLFPSKGWA